MGLIEILGYCCIFILLAFLIFIVVFCYERGQMKGKEQEWNLKYEKALKSWEESNRDNNSRIRILTDENRKLNSKVIELTASSARIEGADEKELDEKQKQLVELNSLLDRTRAAQKAFEEDMKITREKCAKSSADLLQLKDDIEVARKQKESAASEMIVIRGKLDALLASWKAAFQFDNGERSDKWDFGEDLEDREKKLIELLNQLKQLYPELAVEFAGVEWRKVWMPRMQEAYKGNSKLGQGGIYFLELKDTPGYGYVGQAQCFKERWYQHCKKMIGVESKGNEKVYKYRPEDFNWMIVEVIDEKKWKEDKEYVNERERYWTAKGTLNI